MKADRTAKHWEDLLREILLKQDPKLLPLLSSLGTTPLTELQREQLRGAVADELSKTGLDEHDEPNRRGFRLEQLIDVLGDL